VQLTIFAIDNPLQKERKRMEMTEQEQEETLEGRILNIMVIPDCVSSE